jgi:hypothetical protein
MVPVNGRDHMRESRGIVGNMNEAEAAWLCAEVGPSYVIPMHYECIDGNTGNPGHFANLKILPRMCIRPGVAGLHRVSGSAKRPGRASGGTRHRRGDAGGLSAAVSIFISRPPGPSADSVRAWPKTRTISSGS